MIDRQEVWMAALDNVTITDRRIMRDQYQVPMFGASHSSSAQWGVQRIITDSDGFWEPSQDQEEGIEAIIMITNRYYGGRIEDLLAFQPKDPSKCWLYFGQAHWLGLWELGTRWKHRPSHFEQPPFTQHYDRTDDPLHVYENPLEWFRNYCDGAVPLCRQAYGDLADVQAPLTFDSRSDMMKAKRYLQRPVPMPRMSVRAQGEAAA
jgi:hypothetical protein